MDGFKRRTDRKIEDIIRASLELFQAHGFKKVSIGEIASKAEVSPVTIYNHFESKEGLIREVVKRLYLDFLGKFKVVIKSDKPFLEKLETIIFDKTQIADQYQGELIQEAISKDPVIQQFVESMWQWEVNQLMMDLFEEGQSQGFIDTKLSKEAFMMYMHLLRQGVYHSPEFADEIRRNPRLVRELTSLFIYGLNG